MNKLSPQGRVVLYTSMAHALVHVIELTYAALLLRIGADFGESKLVLGAIANVFAFTFGAGALPAGLLVDRLGSRRVITFYLLTAAAAAVLVGLSPNVFVLSVFLALLGLSIGLYHPAGLALLAQTAEQRGLAFGYHGGAGNLGVAIAPAMAVGLAVAFNWRAAYFALAGLALLLVLILSVIHLPEVVRKPAAPKAASAPAKEVWKAGVMLPLLLVYAAYTINGFIYRGSFTFLPTFIEENVHVSILGIDQTAMAGNLTTIALLTGVAGQYLGGALSQNHVLERLAPPLALAVAPALLLMGASSGLALVAAAGAFVFFNFAGQPIYNGLIAEYTPQGLVGRSYGMSFFASFGLGSSAATFAGFFADRWGTGSVFVSLAGVALLVLGLTLVMLRMAGRRRGLALQATTELPAGLPGGGHTTAHPGDPGRAGLE